MTAFSEADLDRLADFVGGALDGTAEADDVRHLVSTDTSWAEAYAMLVAADAAMRDELHALGAEAPAVPPDVQQRLDAVLAGAITAPPADAPVVDLARAREARRRRRARWSIGLATAAAVIVCGGVGVQALRMGTASQDSGTSVAPGLADAPAGGQTRSGSGSRTNLAGGSPLISSGRDYGRATLGQLAGGQPAPDVHKSGNSDVQGEGAAPLEASAPTAVPGPLTRLSAPAARAACLAAITKEYGGQVSLVDYAAFEGQAALVVVVDGTRVGAGKRLIVVVGPDCGVGGAIADERYRTTIP
ncbi:hypothetical protein [Dactylosporangium sp. NPDC051484]|uniref:hypothetical protein n=1 Tax=Dactylosporangium sp. NPDC051484 TaxID=3154942 RepID=UPI00344D6EE6